MPRKIRDIKADRIKISNLFQITSCLKSVASTKRFQIMKQLHNLNRITKAFTSFQNRLPKANFTNKKEMHIVMSCDKKFCKNFITLLNKYLAAYDFPEDAQIIVFGRKSEKIFSGMQNVIQCDGLKGTGDATNIAVRIHASQYPKTIVHAYCPHESAFKSFNLMEQVQDSSNPEPSKKNADFFRMYFASQIYFHALNTAFKENSDRAVSMSEASDNAEKKQEELEQEYHNTRKEALTAESLAWSNG